MTTLDIVFIGIGVSALMLNAVYEAWRLGPPYYWPWTRDPWECW